MNTRPLLIGVVALVFSGGCAQRGKVAQEAVQATLYLKIPDAEAAIKQNPNNALAHQRLGEALAGHDTPRAISEFRKVIRLQSGNRQVRFELAYELKKTGHLPEAKAIYQQLALQDDVWGKSAKRSLQKMNQL